VGECRGQDSGRQETGVVRRVPKIGEGEVLIMERVKRRNRGDGAGAEDREVWPGRVRRDAANWRGVREQKAAPITVGAAGRAAGLGGLRFG
jgi:hypothetical protein